MMAASTSSNTGRDLRFDATADATRGLVLRPSTFVSAFAGFLTPFTISLVGEMPVGELILVATLGWVLFCLAVGQAWPGRLFRSRYLWFLLACQAVALGAYVMSDVYRGSSPHDMARGWARMVFVAVDLLAIAYLYSCSKHNFMVMLFAQLVGSVVSAVLFGALFGAFWKFGIGVPVTYLALLLASAGGPITVALTAVGLGILHFNLDFRSVGGMCFITAAFATVQLLPRRLRPWILPVGVLAAAAIAYTMLTGHDEGNRRASRSDVDRSSMMQAAWEGFTASPLIGQGSWFSNTDVLDNFLLIRAERARLAGIGGFAGPNTETPDVSIHSQILVALAEGGLFGATFFFAFAAGLAWALSWLGLRHQWRFGDVVKFQLLLFAVANVVMSPFSGAHRVYIAMAAGLVLMLRADRHEQLQPAAGASAA